MVNSLDIQYKKSPPDDLPSPRSRLAIGAAAQLHLRQSVSDRLATIVTKYVKLEDGPTAEFAFSKLFSTELRQHILASYLAGLRANGIDISRGRDMTPSQTKEFLDLYERQVQFFQKFHIQMIEKKRKDLPLGPREIARARLYGTGTNDAFNRAKVMALKTREIDPKEILITWHLSPAEHCSSSAGKYGCLEMAAGSPYRMDELTARPGDGGSVCDGNCKCFLVFRKAAKEKFNPHHDERGRFSESMVTLYHATRKPSAIISDGIVPHRAGIINPGPTAVFTAMTREDAIAAAQYEDELRQRVIGKKPSIGDIFIAQITVPKADITVRPNGDVVLTRPVKPTEIDQITTVNGRQYYIKPPVQKFNPHHDERGRFASEGGAPGLPEGRTTDEIAAIKRLERTGGVWKHFQQIVIDNHHERINRMAEQNNLSPEAYESRENGRFAAVLKDSRVYIKAPLIAFEQIIEDERVKNQFESGTSEGLFAPTTRRAVERDVLFISDNVPPRQRPIYGYLTFNENGDDNTQGYGSVTMKLKSDVKKRTTFVYGDSLDDVYSDMDMIPSRITEPSIHSLPFQKTIGTMKGKFIEPVDRAKSMGIYRYIEAQIYGGVHLSDIQEVIITQWPGYPPSKKTLTKLTKSGIKYTIERPGGLPDKVVLPVGVKPKS